MHTYLIQSTENTELSITGKLSDVLWKRANVLSDFKSPWDKEEIGKIEFRALHSPTKFYFSFKVFDTKIHTVKKDDSIESINQSDRVELFFRKDSNMTPYFCLEIDPTPRIMDFKAFPNKVFDFEWNWPIGELEVKSSFADTHFIVEGSISLASLIDLGLLKKNKIEAGIFRAKYNKIASKNVYDPVWITWIDPVTTEPNFHIPSSFGVLELK